MKAMIEEGKIILPREIFEESGFPLTGECEVESMKGWLKIGTKRASRILKDLENPPVRTSIDKIIKAEVVEDV